MAKSLDELTADLKDEVMPTTALDDLPEFGGFQEPPQPGAYRFSLPPRLDNLFELFDTEKGQRLRVIFDRDNPLTIKASSTAGTAVGDTFHTRLSNVKRRRGKEGSVEASDLDYLLRALGEKVAPTTNRGYIQALQKYPAKEFGGDITYSFVCNDQRNIRVMGTDGRSVEVEGRKGCGKKYYTRDVEKVDGKMPTEIQCECGAVLRAFANLENLRP